MRHPLQITPIFAKISNQNKGCILNILRFIILKFINY